MKRVFLILILTLGSGSLFADELSGSDHYERRDFSILNMLHLRKMGFLEGTCYSSCDENNAYEEISVTYRYDNRFKITPDIARSSECNRRELLSESPICEFVGM